jgi:hypothetical protein
MNNYKQPQTRIKRVKDGDGERFYAQHKQLIIPNVWWEWQDTRQSLFDNHYADSLDEAKERIDNFLRKDKHEWASRIEQAARKKVKKEVEIIDYP